MEKSLLARLAVLFVITQALGLFVAIDLIQKINAGELEQPTIITDNPNDMENAIGLMAYILVFTAGILLAIRTIKTELLFRIMEALAVFTASIIVFGVFLGETAVIPAILLLVLKNIFKENLLLRNISSTIAAAGVGAVVGISLGIMPVLVFIVLLSIYDIIAVFYTKHMVVMAKHLTKKNLAFTFALPTKKHQFELGTGDMVIPLAFAASVLKTGIEGGMARQIALVTPTLVLLGSLVGLVATLEYSSRNVGKALPALPPQTVIMIVMLGIGKFFGY